MMWVFGLSGGLVIGYWLAAHDAPWWAWMALFAYALGNRMQAAAMAQGEPTS